VRNLSKKSLVRQTLSLTPYDIEYEDNGNWFGDLKDIEEKIGIEELINKIVCALVHSNADVDDIKIFVSLLSVEYKDQNKLAVEIDNIIDFCRDNPEQFIKDLSGRLDKEREYIEKNIKDKDEIGSSIVEYRSELENIKDVFKKDLEIYQNEINEKLVREKEIEKALLEYKEKIKSIESELQDASRDRKSAETFKKKVIKKSEYEQGKLVEAINELRTKDSQIKNEIENIQKEIDNKIALIEKIRKTIKAKKKNNILRVLDRKGLRDYQDNDKNNNKEITTYEIREELEKLNTVVGRIEPLMINEKGFISTPSTLDIFETLYAENLNPPSEQPQEINKDSDISECLEYYKYKSFWDTDKWDQKSIIRYSFWKSKKVHDNHSDLSAEIALSGIYHADNLKNVSCATILLYRFLCAIGNIGCDDIYKPVSDEQVFEALEIVAEQAEKRSIVTTFIGQLSFTLPKILEYLFDIANPRIRVLLKRCLSNVFNGFINIDERDPSHEVLHLINSESETYDNRMRSVCSRWLMQDSIDAIAQNARNEIMALLARFPDIGRTKSKFILDDFKTQVSTPLSTAVSSGQPDAFEQLSKQCFLFSKKIINEKNWVSSVYLLPCSLHLANLAAAANIQAKRLFRAALSINTDKQHYPLNVPERTCPVEIVINNIGNAEAKELKILLMPSKDYEEADIQHNEPSFNKLAPNNEIRHKVNIKLENPTHALHIDYILSWRDTSSINERSQTGTLKLLSQRNVNWEDIQNPYSLKSIKDPERLKGRLDILNILRRSRNSMDSYYITGQRRTGKSSVAQVYYKELNDIDKHAAIYLLWGDLGSTEIAPICHAVCYEFARNLKERSKEKTIECPKLSDFQGNENFIFRTFFKELNINFQEWKFFIVIDDFDELPASLHQTDKGDQFFTLLRALLDQDYLALYLVGSEKLPEILKRQGERLNLTQRCEIDYIKDTNEITKIIAEPASGVLEFQEAAINEIVRLSSGNPYYATLICSRLFNLMAQNQDYYVSKRDVELSIKVMLEEDSLSTYQHFWKDGVFLPGKLGERQQYHNAKVLISLGRSQTAENQAVMKEILLERDDLNPITQEDAKYAISGLLERKVIVENDGAYTIRVPLFAMRNMSMKMRHVC